MTAIAKDKVAMITMTINDQAGTLIDSTDGGDPLPYLHGAKNLLPALEKLLEGKKAGESVSAALTPEESYGERNEELVRVITRAQLHGVSDIDVGMQFQAQVENGMAIFTVTKVEGDDITVDGNHPYAGMSLTFELGVLEVRDATAEEIEHGHPHVGDGGCGQ